jgi:hypothetical protein
MPGGVELIEFVVIDEVAGRSGEAERQSAGDEEQEKPGGSRARGAQTAAESSKRGR